MFLKHLCGALGSLMQTHQENVGCRLHVGFEPWPSVFLWGSTCPAGPFTDPFTLSVLMGINKKREKRTTKSTLKNRGTCNTQRGFKRRINVFDGNDRGTILEELFVETRYFP